MVGEFIMKTKGISLQTLCAPCNCHCRYCLLSWENNPVGLVYEESEEFAQAFYDWIKTNRPELEFNFSYGYSMDMPQMFRAIQAVHFFIVRGICTIISRDYISRTMAWTSMM